MRVELSGVTKRYPGVLANRSVDLTVEAGEVHALLGENGAGKTTLMRILFGLERPDEGSIIVDNSPVSFAAPADAIASGIAMIHQHFMLVPVFTATENVMLGRERTSRFGRIDAVAARRDVVELSERYGLNVDPDARVEDLSLGAQQRVEILKALRGDARCLILDEPSAILTPDESLELESIVGSLARRGRSVIFITHKLGEAMRVADRITVLREGEVVARVTPAEVNEAELARLMVGRTVTSPASRVVDRLAVDAEPGPPRLRVNNLVVHDKAGRSKIPGISFEIHAREVLAVTGVPDQGQTELVEALTGLLRPAAGTVTLDDEDLTCADPAKLVRSGVGHIPEDRRRVGLIEDFSVADNLVLNTFRATEFSARGVRRRNAVTANAESLKERFDIRVPSVGSAVSTLSGGNQQKVVLARECGHAQKLLVAAQPTRGLDVGSIEYIHGRIIEQRDGGAAVFLVTSDLDEVLALADRVAVMVDGSFVDLFNLREVIDGRGTLDPESVRKRLGERIGLASGNTLPRPQGSAATTGGPL